MKTTFIRPEDVKRTTYLVDARGKVLGRLATAVASLLIGKGRVDFSPHVDGGDAVIVINAGEIRVTGKKAQDKKYKRYSGYPGGLTEASFEEVFKKHPEEIILHAVKGMLPKNILGHRMLKRLRVFSGQEHIHAAQKPEPFTL